MGTRNNYPLHTGFLMKSPPEGAFKRWKRRWFVLLEDKSLCYHKNRNDPNPIKSIDLRCCEFLDTNLCHKRFQNIFSIKIKGKDRTAGRVFYLVADTPYEMKEWVDKICKLCDFQTTENVGDADEPVRHCAPLDPSSSSLLLTTQERRDSGINVCDIHNDNLDDLVPVRVSGIHESPSSTRGADEGDDEPPLYDVPPSHSQATSPHHLHPPNTCPVDDSSSDSSLSSVDKTSSCSDTSSVTYDCPRPGTSSDNYAYPPHRIKPRYDTPNSRPIHDIRMSGGSNDSDNDVYDVPPSSAYDVPPSSAYDVVPAPVSVAPLRTLPSRGMVVQQFPTQSATVRPVGYHNKPLHGLEHTNYSNTLPADNSGAIYDHVPSRIQNQLYSNYDSVPSARPQSDLGNYDIVPPPVALHADYPDEQGEDCGPPVTRDAKPKQAYVNLTFPGPADYKKPLPNTPSQRDSGNGLNQDEAVYDVPPVQTAVPAPCIDRTNKPDQINQISAPKVYRDSKPSQSRDYVNLAPTRSATFKERSNEPSRRGGNVQRSKSAAGDFDSEGYLYMESPRRTESSLRYSKKTRRSSLNEEDENEVYEYMERNGHNEIYENFHNAHQSMDDKAELAPERSHLHYQDIVVLHKRDDAPSVPERASKTQYTTIDLQKTQGFRKTCEDVGKGQ